ncbi:hypothetical protein BN938_2493 [Mucinivorans hirudinis]|uniref:Uncharacterized protein n=1 Tax=Mucinivorans hirudinis TaxID=1433126 RepID=A0A060RDW6_9BACT|nr:hypothetical protein BN938_2493 [Mucinivorans hirudinis]
MVYQFFIISIALQQVDCIDYIAVKVHTAIAVIFGVLLKSSRPYDFGDTF